MQYFINSFTDGTTGLKASVGSLISGTTAELIAAALGLAAVAYGIRWLNKLVRGR